MKLKLITVFAAVIVTITSSSYAALANIHSITGFSGGDSSTSGDFTPLTNGVGITKGDANDPTTWTNTGSAYGEEWYDNHLTGATDGKLGWVSFDLGSALTTLDDLYIIGGNYSSGKLGTATFNIYHATTPTEALPDPPGQNGSIDYDFSSGGWTQLGSTRTMAADTSEDFDLSGITSARYIALELMTTHGTDQRSGFEEIAITAVPEPTTTALLGLGGLILILRRNK